MALPNDIAGRLTAGVVEAANQSSTVVWVAYIVGVLHKLVSPKQ